MDQLAFITSSNLDAPLDMVVLWLIAVLGTLVFILFLAIIYHHRTIRSLKDLHSYTNYIVENTPDLAVRMKNGGDIIMVNPSVCRTSGYSKYELIGKNWWRVFHPDGRNDPEIVEINKVSDSGRIPLIDFEMTLRRKDGEKRRISWNTANRFDPEGNIKEMVAIGKDITDREKRAKWEQEESKMRALAHMTGGLAHEINNALQPILGMADVLIMSFENTEDTKTKEALEILHQNALHARSIVQNILMFSRSGEHQADEHDAIELFNHTVDFVERSLSKGIDIERTGLLVKEIGKDFIRPRIKVAQTGITQIMTNLITNAEYAMDHNGDICIDLELLTKEDIGDALVGMDFENYVVVKVTDNGSGIDPETQRKLFEPFFTTKPVGKGTGLGLSTAYGLVKSWYGAITVDSVEGMGTTFTIYIPADVNRHMDEI